MASGSGTRRPACLYPGGEEDARGPRGAGQPVGDERRALPDSPKEPEGSRAAAEFTGLVLDEMVAGVMTSDSRGCITIFNREAQRLTGYAPDDISRVDPRPGLAGAEPPWPPRAGTGRCAQGPLIRQGRCGVDLEERRDVTADKLPRIPACRRLSGAGGDSGLPGGRRTVEGSNPQGGSRLPASAALDGLTHRDASCPPARARGRDSARHGHRGGVRCRDETLRALEAGTAALAGLLEDVEQYLNCVVTREWDSPPNATWSKWSHGSSRRS